MAISTRTILVRSLTGRLFSTVTTTITVAVAVGLMFVLLAMRDSGMRAFSRGSGTMHLVVSRDAGPLAAVLNAVFLASPPQRKISWPEFQQLLGQPRAGRPPVGAQVDWAIPTQQGDSYRGFAVVGTSEQFFSAFQPAAGEPWRFRQGRAFRSPIEPMLESREPMRFEVQAAGFEVVLGSEAASRTRLRVGQRIHLTHGTGLDTGDQIVSDHADEHADEHDADHDHDAEHEPATSEPAGPHVHAEDAFTVVGILEPTGSAFDRALFIDLGSAWLMHARDFYEQYELQAAAGPQPPMPFEQFAASAYTPDITGVLIRVATRQGSEASAALPQVFAAIRADPGGFTVASPSEQIKSLFQIVGNVNQILLAMAAVVMVSSGIAIMLALYNSMEQRRRQIAVLRVLGASKGRIFGLIVTESALLGLLGAMVGLMLASVGGVVVAGIMRARLGLAIQPSLWITQTMELDGRTVTLPLTPLVLLGAVALAAAAGVIPAFMAYRTSVIRSLRPLG